MSLGNRVDVNSTHRTMFTYIKWAFLANKYHIFMSKLIWVLIICLDS